MDDLGIIDQFVKTFSDYIESGFGLIDADVHFLTAFIIGIDITLAGLYWAMGSDSSAIRSSEVLYKLRDDCDSATSLGHYSLRVLLSRHSAFCDDHRI